jgi:F0F1-type ATP synthase gamma subunit
MEMVSTAKMKKMQSKLDMLRPFSQKIDQIITNLRQSGVEDVFDVFMQEHPNPRGPSFSSSRQRACWAGSIQAR